MTSAVRPRAESPGAGGGGTRGLLNAGVIFVVEIVPLFDIVMVSSVVVTSVLDMTVFVTLTALAMFEVMISVVTTVFVKVVSGGGMVTVERTVTFRTDFHHGSKVPDLTVMLDVGLVIDAEADSTVALDTGLVVMDMAESGSVAGLDATLVADMAETGFFPGSIVLLDVESRLEAGVTPTSVDVRGSRTVVVEVVVVVSLSVVVGTSGSPAQRSTRGAPVVCGRGPMIGVG